MAPWLARGFIKFLCRRSLGFFSWAFLVFLMEKSKKRRRKQPGKLLGKYRSQPVNLSGAQPLMNSLVNALHSAGSGPVSSPNRGHCVVFLGKTLYSHSASLHPGI